MRLKINEQTLEFLHLKKKLVVYNLEFRKSQIQLHNRIGQGQIWNKILLGLCNNRICSTQDLLKISKSSGNCNTYNYRKKKIKQNKIKTKKKFCSLVNFILFSSIYSLFFLKKNQVIKLP